MAAIAGRKMRIKYDNGTDPAAVIAGAQADTFTINNEMIDISDKDDAGLRTLLDDIGVKSFSASGSGVIKDVIIAELAANAGDGTSLHQFEIFMDGFGTYTGQFFITSYEGDGQTAEGASFSFSLESSGAITFAAA